MKKLFLFLVIIFSLLMVLGGCQSEKKNNSSSASPTSTPTPLSLGFGNPRWSPDGKLIALTSNLSGDYDLWVMDADGSNLTKLAEKAQTAEWSPGGSRIAFESLSSGNSDVWVMASDGTNLINLTASNLGADRNPKWSSSGKYLAYVAEDPSRINSNVWIIEPNGSNPAKLTLDRNYVHAVLTWSPDDLFIAATVTVVDPEVKDFADITQDSQVHINGFEVIPVDGSEIISLAPNQHISRLLWSPQGNTIAFSTYEFDAGSVDTDIWIVQPDGSGMTNLTEDNPLADSACVWSPDGRYLAFASVRNSRGDLYSLRIEDSTLTNLTPDFGGYFLIGNPTWSPDGQKIAFSLDNGNGPDIWVINADGSNPVNLTAAYKNNTD